MHLETIVKFMDEDKATTFIRTYSFVKYLVRKVYKQILQYDVVLDFLNYSRVHSYSVSSVYALAL